MTSFLSIAHYSPLLVLLVGLSTFAGLWGLGTALLNALHLRLPSPWDHVTAILLGIQGLSLTVQVAGIAEIASPQVLRGIWWVLIVTGASVLLLRARSAILSTRPWTRVGPAILPIAIIAAAILSNALVALAPSTKIDELYYHMLLPSRIVSDGALRFYQEPWLSAIWPQMVYQISAAPTHAMGFPDATNVVSWAVSGALLWFAWQIIRTNANTLTWIAISVASLCVGIYPAVWHVTGGAHAMGDLAMAAAMAAFCLRERLLAALPPLTFTAMLSVLLLSAATSKVSLLPVCGLLLCAGLWPLVKSAPPLAWLRIASVAAVPWILFYCPIVWWTWSFSGSPFGPILAGVFQTPIYSHSWLQKSFQFARDTSQLPLLGIQGAALGYSPLIWLGAIAALFASDLDKWRRIFLGSLLALQCFLIYRFLPYEVRYLSLHYGLFIVFAFFGPPTIQEWLNSARGVIAACLIFLFPWLAIQIYYAKQFFPVSAGLEKESFYQRYIPLYLDYVELERLLPKDTVLLSPIPASRVGSVYAPRPIFFDIADLPTGKQVALIALEHVVPDGDLLNGLSIEGTIYEDTRAVIKAYRTPGRAPLIGSLQVLKTRRD
jgi:hypothetical protein